MKMLIIWPTRPVVFLKWSMDMHLLKNMFKVGFLKCFIRSSQEHDPGRVVNRMQSHNSRVRLPRWPWPDTRHDRFFFHLGCETTVAWHEIKTAARTRKTTTITSIIIIIIIIITIKQYNTSFHVFVLLGETEEKFKITSRRRVILNFFECSHNTLRMMPPRSGLKVSQSNSIVKSWPCLSLKQT